VRVQFNAFIAIVKDMMSQVELEHRTKLEQLNSLQQENRFVESKWWFITRPLVA